MYLNNNLVWYKNPVGRIVAIFKDTIDYMHCNRRIPQNFIGLGNSL